jgi:hypothetical protein
MLNIGLNANLRVTKTVYPVYFQGRNICIHCGANNSLVLVDVFGRETKQEIHPFSHFKCRRCGQSYSIRWDTLEDGKMTPSAVDSSIKNEFVNLFNIRNIKKNGEMI